MRTREWFDDAASQARTEFLEDEIDRVVEFQHLTLDVLLDIRDLLQGLQPPTYTITLEDSEVKIDDERLRGQD